MNISNEKSASVEKTEESVSTMPESEVIAQDTYVNLPELPSFTKLLIQALEAWKTHWLPVTALMLAPTVLIIAIGLAAIKVPYSEQIALFVATLFTYIAGCGVIAVALGFRDSRTSVSGAFHAAITLAIPLLVIAVIRGLATTGGIALFIIPGIYISIVTMFAQYVYVKDGTKGFTALAESWRIISPQIFPIILRMFLLWAVGVIVLGVAGVIAGFLMTAVTLSLSAATQNMIMIIVTNLIFTPIVLFFSIGLFESVRALAVLGGDESARIKKLQMLFFFGIVVVIALAFFVGYALVEYGPNFIQNAILRFSPPGFTL